MHRSGVRVVLCKQGESRTNDLVEYCTTLHQSYFDREKTNRVT